MQKWRKRVISILALHGADSFTEITTLNSSEENGAIEWVAGIEIKGRGSSPGLR